MKKIYLDNAATTPLDGAVKREIWRALDTFGNPASVYADGRKAQELLEQSKARLGQILNCRTSELIICGSGTEANNLAIFGVAQAHSQQGKHIISTNIEHHSILRPLQALENQGFEVEYLSVNADGLIDPKQILKAIRPDTILISIIYANNEIGTIQSIQEIVRKIKLKFHKDAPIFHVDACQAAGALDLNVQNLGVDLMTINGSKIYGPKGVGALFVRRGVDLRPQILGGDQEFGRRAGTQNPALAVGLAKALEIADRKKDKENIRLTKLRDWFIDQALASIPGTYLNGHPAKRLPNNINLSFEDIDGEMLMLRLDLKGIEVSTGAACTVTSNEPSHVLKAIGSKLQAPSTGNLRLTLGRQTTKRDLEHTLKILKHEIEFLRR